MAGRILALTPLIAGFAPVDAAAVAAASSRRAVVTYLVSASGDSTAGTPEEVFPSSPIAPHPWQWRVFDPSNGRDVLVFTLPSFPTRVRWDPAFDSVEFVISNRIARAAWRVGARPREQAQLPLDSALCDFWRDATNHRWHAITQREIRTPSGPGTFYALQVATRWDQDASGRWNASEVDSGGDANGGCFTSARLYRDAPPAQAATMSALLDSMRVEHHRYSKLGETPEGGDEDSDWLVYVPSVIDSALGIEVKVGFGDSPSAIEPVVWVNHARRARKTVYGRDDTPDWAPEQVAFAERRGFLLIASEYSGAFPAVVDLRSGKVLLRVSRPSARAVWVQAPR